MAEMAQMGKMETPTADELGRAEVGLGFHVTDMEFEI
jgi:hypothetical protein